MFFVTGGIYRDFKWKEKTKDISFGPFETYREAKEKWQSEVWLNVDNALHRLTIEER